MTSKRTIFAATLALAAALALPSMAAAHHHHARHHHSRHHHRIMLGSTGTGTNAPSGDQAGTVASFDGTTLVINLTNGGTVSGKVTNETEISCITPGSGEDQGTENDSESSGSASGSDSSSGSESSDEQTQCTTADLTPGTVVQNAELDVSSAGSVFDEVTLVK